VPGELVNARNCAPKLGYPGCRFRAAMGGCIVSGNEAHVEVVSSSSAMEPQGVRTRGEQADAVRDAGGRHDAAVILPSHPLLFAHRNRARDSLVRHALGVITGVAVCAVANICAQLFRWPLLPRLHTPPPTQRGHGGCRCCGARRRAAGVVLSAQQRRCCALVWSHLGSVG
jgi:hypothetical protein